MLMMDLKISSLSDSSKKTAGKELAKRLLQTVFREEKGKEHYEPVFISFSLQSGDDGSFIEGAMEILNEPRAKKYQKYIGWDSGFYKDPAKIAAMWKKGNVGPNIWQGDGITTCLWFLKSYKNILKILNDRNTGGVTKKVYIWTIITKTHIKKALKLVPRNFF